MGKCIAHHLRNESMNHIEIIGPPGAGKSTLQDQMLADRNITGNDRRYRCILITSPLFKIISQTTNRTQPWEKIANIYWEHVLYPKYIAEFQSIYPDIFEICKKAGRLDDRIHYPKMYYNSAAELLCLQDYSNKSYVIDEGLSQLAAEVLSINQELGEQYLQLIPVPDVVIRVDCAAEKCLRRQLDREKPTASSIQEKSTMDAIDKLEMYINQHEIAADHLNQRGSEVVHVNTFKKDAKECLTEIQSAIDVGN